MINRRLCLWIIILVFFILVSYILHLPSKGISLLTRYFLKYKYGLSAEWTGFKGGFANGITLEEVRVSDKGSTVLQCPQVSSNIRFKDFIFSRGTYPYYISLERPELSVKNPYSFQAGISALPLDAKVRIFVSGAQLALEDSSSLITLKLDDVSGEITKDKEVLAISFLASDQLTELTGEIDLNSSKGTLEILNGKIEFPNTNLPPIGINGGAIMDTRGIKIERGKVSLGELELEVGGILFADRTIDLEVSSGARESSFLVRGSLDEPLVVTNWGVIETVFQIEGVQYNNGRLIFPRVVGEIQLPGFMPFELEGKLTLGIDLIGFEDITLAKVVNIEGVISKHRESRLRLWLENIPGLNLAAQLPEALRPLICSHKVSAQLSVYGNIDNLQGGGLLNLFSYPMKIACRYRHNRFSFRSIDQGPFRVSGSINLGKEPSLRVKGDFHEMNSVDLMGLFSEDINPDCKGTLDGQFSISGELNDPLIQAKLEIKEGQIGDVRFDEAYINLEGTGSMLNLKHSMIYYKEIPAELTGYIDPRGKDLFSNVNILPATDSFIWKGLNVVKDTSDRIVIFGQDVSDDFSVQIKAPLSSDPEDGGADSEPEVEVEYKLLEDKSILIKMEEDEGTVGIEHKVKF